MGIWNEKICSLLKGTHSHEGSCKKSKTICSTLFQPSPPAWPEYWKRNQGSSEGCI